MSTDPTITERIAVTLREHVQSVRNGRCACGWRGDVSKSIIDPNNIHQQHRRHVAEILAVLVSNAWDAGHEEGWLNKESGLSESDGRKRNPYKDLP